MKGVWSVKTAAVATMLALAAWPVAMGMTGLTAAAAVPRYQFHTATLTANVNGGAYIHTYTITISPCDSSFEGSGGINSLGLEETVDGAFSGQYVEITFDSVYTTFNPGYTFSYSGPLTGGGTITSTGNTVTSLSFSLANIAESATVYKSHGDYVSQVGGGEDAAHSCIGMPLPHTWSASGTIDSASMTGTTVTLPDTATGIYIIQISGYWLNTPHGEVDAQYNNGDSGVQNGVWSFYQEGWPSIGSDWGRVLVNGSDVDWGAYTSTHTYSIVMPLAGSATLQMGVHDAPGPSSWYDDNVGTLDYTITYLQP